MKLTPEEHYVAHQVLVKIYPNDYRLLWAASNMTGKTHLMRGRKNKLYGWLKRRLAEYGRKAFLGKRHSDESRLKMSKARKGVKRKPHSDETKAKMSAASKGRRKSAAHIAACSKARKGVKRGPHSAEWIRNLTAGVRRSIATRDETFRNNPEYREKQRRNMKRIWAERKSHSIAQQIGLDF